ncbi:MAG: hypothetical protein ABGX71_02800 [Methyloprofundus sp.]|nr:hypothetical protein [Methyloprofundus sp.]
MGQTVEASSMSAMKLHVAARDTFFILMLSFPSLIVEVLPGFTEA